MALQRQVACEHQEAVISELFDKTRCYLLPSVLSTCTRSVLDDEFALNLLKCEVLDPTMGDDRQVSRCNPQPWRHTERLRPVVTGVVTSKVVVTTPSGVVRT